ncbi:hypothetical protein AXF42_Ash011343 [Apostasia shenzhenica]|uniref:Uncharacterized protein n=1 Tax=Apostasia shenzhenica TaxID=1088818 RepID=A0A2I0AE96_9ASPA|nr:hypothetical protein AXF42_Ash011343 [Apostasia shenzhenica]
MASSSTPPATPLPVYQAPANSYHSSGSIGPFFAVISVIVVLAALSCVFGRVCASETTESPDSSYSCLEWMKSHHRKKRSFRCHMAAKTGANAHDGSEHSLPSSQP